MWQTVFWVALALITLAPLFAIWRNLTVLAAIYAEALTKEGGMRRAIETGLQTIFAFAIAIWVWLLLPLDRGAIATAATVVALLCMLLLLLRRKLIKLHSRVEDELVEVLEAADERPVRGYQQLLQPHQEWNIQLKEVVLPDNAECSGQTLSELELRRQFGCSVAGVERHGFPIPNPSPDLVLYPGDKLLLLATPEQMAPVRDFIGRSKAATAKTYLSEDIEMEGVIVPESSPAAGNMLIELEIPAATGVQIVGIERAGNHLLNPGPFQTIEAGDRLLVLGTHQQIEQFEHWLRRATDQ